MHTTTLTTTTKSTALSQQTAAAMALAGQVADRHAELGAFADYLSQRAENTLRRQQADLQLFSDYLMAAGVPGAPGGEALQTAPEAWQGVSWGLVDGFVKWQLEQGFAIGSVNVRLSTVKTYAALAQKAGVLTSEALAMIQTVRGYGRKAGKNVNEKREAFGFSIRVGEKKAEAVQISKEQADALKGQPHTAQGRRDALIMALLLDHGLRVSELALLEVGHFNLKEGTFKFYRPKVDKEQQHRLTADAQRAVQVWLASEDAPALGVLLRGSRKGGQLTGQGMSERAITDRVRVLGEQIGVQGLSAHDCRHYWATRAASQGTDPFALQEAGGWASLAMPRHYVQAAKIANEGVKL
jgi:integrase